MSSSDATLFKRLSGQVLLRMSPALIHDLRVLVRRIRARVWLARQAGARLDTLRRDLRRLGRALGERRLLDVAVIDAKTYRIDPAPLAERIEKAGARVRRRLSRRLALATLIAAVPDTVAVTPKAVSRVTRRLTRAAARARRGPDELHRLRIEAKKVRYLLDALGRDGSFIKPIQDRIGRAHDLEVLQELLGPHPRAAAHERRDRAAAYRMLSSVVARAVTRLNTPDRQRRPTSA